MQQEIEEILANYPGYPGKILRSDRYSAALRRRLLDCVACYRRLEEIGCVPMPYIAAWEGDDKQIWYEYVGKSFTDMFACQPQEVGDVFRRSVAARHIYKRYAVNRIATKEIISRHEIDGVWTKLREEGKQSGLVEAVYKVSNGREQDIWLKDQATIEIFAGDGVCLSLGFLTIVSKEMEAESKLKQHHDLLESIVQERTAELLNLNTKLQQEIEERKTIQNMLKYSNEQLLQNIEEIVRAMSLTLEQRDPYTAGHQRRTTELALAIAREMGRPDHEQRGLQMAGLIHDMGKISVPGEILSKPGGLNDAELQLIKSHPQVAYDILHQIDFPWPVDRIVLEHHEKIDGSGYPRGLYGDDILLEAKILCVADVVETMEAHRPYRPSLGRAAALEEISKNRGKLYDPQVVDACLRLFQESRFQYSAQSASWQPEIH